MRNRGFSLIEVLVVVAVIAILTAIAVPNFARAQLRSQISRVKADLRTMAVAIEAYSTDHGKPPPQSAGLAGTPFDYVNDQQAPGSHGTATLTYAITTPVAYLSTCMLYDPVAQGDPTIAVDERLYTYQAYQWKWPEHVSPTGFSSVPDTTQEPVERWTGLQWKAVYGKWRVLSIGPDRTFYNRIPAGGSPFPVWLPYDPTNGLISLGNIMRSEKEPDQTTFLVY